MAKIRFGFHGFGFGFETSGGVGLDLGLPGQCSVMVYDNPGLITHYRSWIYGGVSGVNGGWTRFFKVDATYDSHFLSLRGTRIRMILTGSTIGKNRDIDAEFWVYGSDGTPIVVLPRRGVKFDGIMSGDANIDAVLEYHENLYPKLMREEQRKRREAWEKVRK